VFIRNCSVIGFGLLVYSGLVCTADTAAAYIINEDSHPHRVAPGGTARFDVESTNSVARLNVKCSLEGDDGLPLTAVTLRTRGLSEVEWPFAAQTIRVERRIDFDITALTAAGFDGLPYYEFVNEDGARALWHQCYNT
jgi:hypothetical protein